MFFNLKKNFPFALSLSKGLFFSILFISFLSATERIELFKSDITVNSDGSLFICETIKVHAEADQIRRGIVREFPTLYADRWGNRVAVQFRLTKVERDGAAEPYHLKDASNGKKVFIGDADVLLQPGNYTYILCYTTNRQIGFFKDHDELYFNVTGNGWRLPIERAVALVHLPANSAPDKLQLEAYTGYTGDQSHDATWRVTPSGALFFETTQPLNVYQGLTIVAGWPKGIVAQPTWWQEIRWFFEDNRAVLILLIGLLAMLVYYFIAWRRVRALEGNQPVIPLFYPPENMTAGAVRYFDHRNYDSKTLAADVVQMAVDGYITIEQSKVFSWTPGYTLHKKADPELDYVHSKLFTQLFAGRQTVALSKSNQHLLSLVYEQEERRYRKSYGEFLESNIGKVVIASLFGMVMAFMSFLLQPSGATFFWWFVVAAMVGTTFLFIVLLRSYTQQGLIIKRQIDGFKMFLEATEKDRFDIIGTPPTKTPELYEKYLPYAIALGVEKQWSKQFAPVFELMRQQGNPYVIGWYAGRSFDRFDSSYFASNIGSSISSAISSSNVKPGSSSGFGGRGSSGGGGGGGGGGGW